MFGGAVEDGIERAGNFAGGDHVVEQGRKDQGKTLHALAHALPRLDHSGNLLQDVFQAGILGLPPHRAQALQNIDARTIEDGQLPRHDG